MNEPRYKQNLFVSDEKHLTRTINTYIAYENVSEIYLYFNEVKNKYQIFVCIDYEEEEDRPYEAMLVYDRGSSQKNSTNTNKLLSVLVDTQIKRLWNEDILKNLKELILKYSEDDKTHFFSYDSEEIMEQIKIFLPYSGSYIQKPSNKIIQNKDMIVKRLYYTLFNRVYYNDDYFSELSELKDYKCEVQEEILEDVLKKLSSFKNEDYEQQLYNYENIKYKEYTTNYTYEELIIAIELFEAYGDELAPKEDIDTLLQEKFLHEWNLNIESLENNQKNKMLYSLKSAIPKYFKEYVKVKIYFEKNNKNFTKNAITRYINEFCSKYGKTADRNGIKRRTGIKNLEKEYGPDFRKFHKKIKPFKENGKSKHIWTEEILQLHKYRDLLTIFNDYQLDKIFNDCYKETPLKKQPLKAEKTLYEKKLEDGYFELKEQLNHLQEQLKHLEQWKYSYSKEEFEEKSDTLDNESNQIDIFQKLKLSQKALLDTLSNISIDIDDKEIIEEPIDVEIKALVRDMDYIDKEIRTIHKKYANTPIHPFAQKYLDNKEKLQGFADEEEYNSYKQAQNEYPKFKDFYNDTDTTLESEDENHPSPF